MLALPLQHSKGCVHMGRYGLYLKDATGKNDRLDRAEWDAVYKGFV